MSRRRIISAFAVLTAALFATTVGLRWAVPSLGNLPTEIEGIFPRNGHAPGQPLEIRLKLWGSWAGADGNTGSIRFGPFAAPSTLTIAVSGYPNRPGNLLQLERIADGARFDLPGEDPGESWRIRQWALPGDWRGSQVTLVATDRSTDNQGWIGVSRPISIHAIGTLPFLETLSAWLLSGTMLAGLWVAALRLFQHRGWTPLPWTPLAAWGAVAFAGYVSFWTWFLHPRAGQALNLLLLAVAAAACLREWRRPAGLSDQSDDWRQCAGLQFVIGLFYVSVLHLFPAAMDFYTLAAERFVQHLPYDNFIPHIFAERIATGVDPRDMGNTWLSSDRPPLQSGWNLLSWLPLQLAGFDLRTASGAGAIWFQLLWIPAALGILQATGLSGRRPAVIVIALCLSGFFIQHSLYTWPKLSAAAFTLGTFGLWILPAQIDIRRAATGAALAGLAWLSHGGAAFSLLPLAAWVAWRCLRHAEWRRWIAAATVFAALVAPWIAYQKWYNPPGNRLIKWHLADAGDPADPRGTFEALVTSYRDRTAGEFRASTQANVEWAMSGSWSSLFGFSPDDAARRRTAEFFHAIRALGWWLAGIPCLLAGLLLPGLRSRLVLAPTGRLFLWAAITLLAWCALMFIPGSTVLHQGSFAMMLAFFLPLAVWIVQVSPHLFGLVATLQAATFVTTWAVPNDSLVGSAPVLPAVAGIALSVVSAIPLLKARDRNRMKEVE